MLAHQYSKVWILGHFTLDFALGVFILCEECRPEPYLRSLVGTVYFSCVLTHENWTLKAVWESGFYFEMSRC